MSSGSVVEDLFGGGYSAATYTLLPTLSTAVAILVFLRIALNYYRWRTSPLNEIPGPSQSFFAGCIRELRKEPFMAPHRRWWAEQRALRNGADVPLIRYTTLAGRLSVLVLDKDVARTILSAPECRSGSNQPRFAKRFVFLRARIGDGLVTLEGRDWMRHRRIIQPSFSTGVLREQLATVVPPVAERLVECWKEMEGAEIDVSAHLSAATLDVVGIVLFSHEFNAVRALQERAGSSRDGEGVRGGGDSTQGSTDSFATALHKAMKFNILSVICNASGLSWLDVKINPSIRRNCMALNHVVDGVLRNAKRKRDQKGTGNGISNGANKSTISGNGNDNGDGNGNNSKSLIQLLFDAQDPARESGSNRKLSWEELRDEAKTFLMAGHETTATWLLWTAFALAKHPDVQERLHREIISSSNDAGMATPSVEAMESMVYLNAVLTEALRLYNPVGMITRVTTGHETLAGYDVPPDTRLTLSFTLLHRHPKYWDDPDSFLPERWIDPSAAEVERRRHAFLPFSAGVRNCIGQKFAWTEARAILVPIVRDFVVRIAPSQRDVEHELTNNVTLKPKPALKIVAKRRV